MEFRFLLAILIFPFYRFVLDLLRTEIWHYEVMCSYSTKKSIFKILCF